MEIRFVSTAGARPIRLDELEALLAGPDGFCWVDVPSWTDDAEALLLRLGCHARLIEACRRRNYVPVVHTYPGQVFVTVHAPLLGGKGHVHLLELDLVVGERVLVTVHGPINPDLDLSVCLTETDAVRARLDAGRMSPDGPADLAYAVTSAVARSQSALIHQIAERLPGLEKEVMTSRLRSPEELLERMFLIRHELMTGRTMAAQCHEVWARIAGLGRFAREGRLDQAADLADQFARVRSLADGETMFLVAVIELYQTKVHTKMTVAMERLAVIAAVTLPVTALASIYGMNVIVNDETHWRSLLVIVLVMITMSGLLLRWARRQGWW
ncbi:magnesium transporter CorA family protein [Nocardioides bigeumensis]|uniref:Magnesium transporter n=1 Tax=Nocardioides bigeumensis TaxID=433657 RepID=A0ABN2YZA1_9ACTN